MRNSVPKTLALLALCAPAANAQMAITEFAYKGFFTEFVEFTNVGTTSIDMTGWSYDDDSQTAGTVDLTAFGTVLPGESVILSESDGASFIAEWNLSGVKVIGNNSANLGRNDEINLFDGSGALVDRLTFGDQNFPGTIRTDEATGWTFKGNVGKNNIYFWVLSTPGDAQGSVTATSGDVGSPGVYVPVTPTASFARFNEVYFNHSGTDDHEFIEVFGVPEGPLTNVMVLVVEGDGAGAGTLDRVIDLTGNSIPATDNYFVLGNTLVQNLDLDIGGSNVIENGTETFYLILADDPSAVTALLGTNVMTGPGTTVIPALGTLLDIVAVVDGGFLTGTDSVFDGAPTVGPDAKSFTPPGFYLGDDMPGTWCGAFLDFDLALNQLQPRTPGEPNSPCYIVDYGAGCSGNGGFTPRLQARADTAAGGTMEFSVFDAEGGALAVVLVGFSATDTPISPACNLLVGPAPIFPFTLPLGGNAGVAGEGDLTVSYTIPVTAGAGTVFFQAFCADGTKPEGFAASNGVALTIH